MLFQVLRAVPGVGTFPGARRCSREKTSPWSHPNGGHKNLWANEVPLHSPGMLQVKRLTMLSADKNMEQPELSYFAGGHVKQFVSFL